METCAWAYLIISHKASLSCKSSGWSSARGWGSNIRVSAAEGKRATIGSQSNDQLMWRDALAHPISRRPVLKQDVGQRLAKAVTAWTSSLLISQHLLIDSFIYLQTVQYHKERLILVMCWSWSGNVNEVMLSLDLVCFNGINMRLVYIRVCVCCLLFFFRIILTTWGWHLWKRSYVSIWNEPDFTSKNVLFRVQQDSIPCSH